MGIKQRWNGMETGWNGNGIHGMEPAHLANVSDQFSGVVSGHGD